MFYQTDDVRIRQLKPLIPPAILMEELPITEPVSVLVARTREEVAALLQGRDERLLVVVGPCSLHDPVAGLDYATRLAAVADELREDLLVVMRVYFEKPRTIVGWKGLINDPHLDGSFAINEGMRIARRFLLSVNALGLPAGTEFYLGLVHLSDGLEGTRRRGRQPPTSAAGGSGTPPERRFPPRGETHLPGTDC